MEERVIATECKTCGGLVGQDDETAVRYHVPLEGRHYVHHADCWRNGSPQRRGQYVGARPVAHQPSPH